MHAQGARAPPPVHASCMRAPPLPAAAAPLRSAPPPRCSVALCRGARTPAAAASAPRCALATADEADDEAAGAAHAALPAASVSFIGSVNNAYVKHAVKLRTSRAYRDAAGTLLLSGGRILEEVAGTANGGGAGAPPLHARVLLLAPGAPPPRGVRAERTLTVAPDVLRKVVGVESGDSLNAVAELYAPRIVTPTLAQVLAAPRVLLLDGVQDPGNLGTLLRSAAALRFSAACLLPGCCDPANDKAVRAARGAGFRLPLWRATWSQLAALADASRAVVLGADPRGDAAAVARAARDGAAPGAPPLWLALGAEGPGLSEQALALCTPVAIPNAGGMESLNVAVAGSILMYILAPPAPEGDTPRG